LRKDPQAILLLEELFFVPLGEWQEEEQIPRFWLDTGIDAIAMDAVNWNAGYSWNKGHQPTHRGHYQQL
jgi:hypothetical protein